MVIIAMGVRAAYRPPAGRLITPSFLLTASYQSPTMDRRPLVGDLLPAFYWLRPAGHLSMPAHYCAPTIADCLSAAHYE